MDMLNFIVISAIAVLIRVTKADYGNYRYHINYLSSKLPANSSMIKVGQFSVPRFVPLEEDVKLECDYVVEGDTSLYSLKWYKGGAQFYEYIPSKVRKHTIFPVQGLRHDQVIAGQDGRTVTLQDVGIGATDQYRCEIVAEGPPFHTVMKQGNLTVVVLPRGNPQFSGRKQFYHSHEFIILNCTPPLSKPAASVQWYINNNPVSDKSRVRTIAHYVNPAGLESITSQLTLEVQQANFIEGKLNIQCEASLAQIYLEASNLVVQEPTSNWFVTNNLYLTSGQTSWKYFWNRPRTLILGFIVKYMSSFGI